MISFQMLKNKTIRFYSVNHRYLTLLVGIILMFSLMHNGYAEVKSVATLENNIWHTKVGKQVQITTDVTNSQDRPQPFAYIVQVQNQDGVVYSLSWIAGTLEANQSLNPSQSWIPTTVGNYTAQVFVWTSVDNPDALSPPQTMKIVVN